MNIIFLDIDGVLTTRETDFHFKKECIDNLLLIIKETRAKIVICSSWKEETLNKTLKLLPEQVREHVLDQTPSIPGKSKGEEVQLFLHKNPNLQWFTEDEYIILDDEPEQYLPFQRGLHLVTTDIKTGLSEENTKIAIRMLQN